MSATTTYRIVDDDGARQTTDTDAAEQAARDGARVTAVMTDADAPTAFDRLEHASNPYRGFGDE
jgi:hypothetical protein